MAARPTLTEDMYEMVSNTREGIDFSFHCGIIILLHFHPYIAAYQMMNASLAFFTMELLREDHGIPVETLIRGISQTRWEDGWRQFCGGDRGRSTQCGRRPQICGNCLSFPQRHEITLLFSAVSDKNYREMIRTVCESIRPKAVVATQIWGSRIVPAGAG